MKTQTNNTTTSFLLKLLPSLLTMAGAGLLFTATLSSPGQEARFFRISGPAATAIIAFRPDGTMVWSNAQPGATYTIQTVQFLPGGTNWTDYVQILAINGVNTNL